MRIAFAATFAHWGMWDPTWLEPGSGKMLGGGETALIHISNQFAKMGHTVHVFAVTSKEALYGPEDAKVHWHPLPYDPTIGQGSTWEAQKLLDQNGPWDVTIGCDMPLLYRPGHRIQSKLHVLDSQCNHGVNTSAVSDVDLVVARSWWHVKALAMLVPGQLQKEEQWAVVPNAIDPNRYMLKMEKVPHRLIWSSSPDRGLHHMVKIWPFVRKQVPDAELHVYYEFDHWFESVKWGMNQETGIAWEIKEGLKQEGIVVHGAVNQWQLAKAQLEASLFAYPCDTQRPSEGFCITALENMAAGNLCLLSSCDALPEVYGGHALITTLPIIHEAWGDMIAQLLEDKLEPKKMKRIVKNAHKLAGEYIWPNVGKHYMKHLEKALKRTTAPK